MVNRFQSRLMGLANKTPTDHLPLTPLATRLCDALDAIGETMPQIAMVALAVRKQMAKSPIPDVEIAASLMWVETMIGGILAQEIPEGWTDGTDELSHWAEHTMPSGDIVEVEISE